MYYNYLSTYMLKKCFTKNNVKSNVVFYFRTCSNKDCEVKFGKEEKIVTFLNF